MTNITKTSRSLLAGLALAASLGLASGSAHAGDVFWSIGMSQPGIHIGVGNFPAPVIIGAPVVVHPRPVYVPPPRVVYLPPRPVYYGYQDYHGHGRWHERHDRRDDRRGHDHRRDDRDDHRGGRDLHGGPRR